MVETTRICSRNNCVEGGIDPDGNIIKFEDGRKLCVRCHDYMKKNRTIEKRSDYCRGQYPTPLDSCVYALKADNEIVYIGESSKTPWRLYQHYNNNCNKSIFHKNNINKLLRKRDYSWHILWYGDNDEYRKYQEKELIKLHQPKFNKRHNNG